MRHVAEQTGNRIRLGPGTLYSSIQSLLEESLIQEVDSRSDRKLGNERRRYYHPTTAGRQLARAEVDRLADLLRVARAKKILWGTMSEKIYAFLLRLFARLFRMRTEMMRSTYSGILECYRF